MNDIEGFVADMSYEQFIKDRKTLNAVVRSIEVIGEASKRLPESLKAKNSELPWREIVGMRGKLIHAYFGMDTETIWKTVKENIPQLGVKNWYFGLYTALKLNNMTHEHFAVDYVVNDRLFRPKPMTIAGYKFRFLKLAPRLLKFGITENDLIFGC